MAADRCLRGVPAALVAASTFVLLSGLADPGAHARTRRSFAGLCEDLGSRAVADWTRASETLYVVYQTPSRGKDGVLKVQSAPGGLPPADRAFPGDGAPEPGFYIGVTHPGRRPKLDFLVRLGNPEFVVGETPSTSASSDAIEGQVLHRVGGAVATHVPFIPGGTLIGCEIGPGVRPKLHFAIPLRNPPFHGIDVTVPP